jgi:hypothetical protein
MEPLSRPGRVWRLAAGQQFSRSYSFERVVHFERYPGVWKACGSCTSFDQEEGREFIEVIEIVESRTLGKLAIYRTWLVAPDGEVSKHPWSATKAVRPESRLRQKINVGNFRPDTMTVKKVRPKRQRPAPVAAAYIDNVVRLPSRDERRRIENTEPAA